MGVVKFIFLILPLLYLLSWFLTLCGLAASQRWCEGNGDSVLPSLAIAGGSFFALSTKCSHYFRFAWWVWVFSTLPVLLAFALPFLARHSRYLNAPTTALWCILIPLLMVLTNAFNNFSEVPGIGSSGNRRLEVATAGFALQTIFALLIIFTQPFLSLGDHDDHDSAHRDMGKPRGGRASGAYVERASPSPGPAQSPYTTGYTTPISSSLPPAPRETGYVPSQGTHSHTTTAPAHVPDDTV